VMMVETVRRLADESKRLVVSKQVVGGGPRQVLVDYVLLKLATDDEHSDKKDLQKKWYLTLHM
jgi:hypothetical protein